MRKLLTSLLVLSVITAAGFAAQPTSAASDNTAFRSINAADYQWAPFAEGSPLSVVPLWGDRNRSGEYAILLKLPAGFKAPVHSHSLEYHALSVQGNWIHTDAAGQPAQPLAQGSYVYQPAKINRSDACAGPQDCILFIHQRGRFDFTPAKPAS
jgi:hypothetical protein